MERPDHSSREPGDLARIFRFFGEVECPQLDAPLYQALCRGIAADDELLEVAGYARPTQPPPNLLFAAVHYLLLGGAPHALREFYPSLADRPAGDPTAAFGAFRDFCLAHREAIVELVATRLTQTNVIQRCSGLLPAFARVYAAAVRPLALIEIGPSAGFNLLFDRFQYDYGDGAVRWGDPESRVRVPCALRGDVSFPPLPESIPVASRCGVDLRPIDPSNADEIRWLRALVWPEHTGRQERLTGAIEIALRHRPQIATGDASVVLPTLIDEAPRDARVCVYGTHTLYQFPKEALVATLRAMQSASRDRPIDFVSIEGSGDRHAEIQHTTYRDGQRSTTLVAKCNPHGRWLEWLAPAGG